MQEETSRSGNLVPQQGGGQAVFGVAAVDVVAHDRMPHVGEMNADLVGPARQRAGFHEAYVREDVEDPKGGSGGAAAFPHGHLLAVLGVPANRSVHFQRLPRWASPNQRKVDFLNAPLLELRGQFRLGRVILRKEQDAGSLLVQPVEKSGPPRARTGREMPDAAKTFTSVSSQWPFAGWVTRPEGLSTARHASSS